MTDIPQEFNWVQARSKCSIGEVFNKLRIDVEDDVKSANLACNLRNDAAFSVEASHAGDAFIVSRPQSGARVKFYRRQDCIEVIDEINERKFRATLTLNDEGRCKLKMEDKELERWQVRRRILEGVFFGSTSGGLELC